MAENAQTQKNVASSVKTQFGQMNVDAGTESIKTPVINFRGAGVYIGLKTVCKYDEATGRHKDPVPQLVSSFGGHFVELPIDGEWWKQFSEFASDLAAILDGISIQNVNVSGDVEDGKRMMAQFRKA